MSGKSLKPVKDSHDYSKVDMKNQAGKFKSLAVHKLGAYVFLDNPENKLGIDPADRDKTNNACMNLRFATYSENN
jgi:hypothetical protein